MKKQIMAVYDEDPFYAERFAEALNQREKIPFTVIAFTSIEKLKAFSNENPIEVLLADQSFLEEIREVRSKQIVALSGGGQVSDSGDIPTIYKYQSADAIIREVMACYCTRPGEMQTAAVGHKSILIGVYSPVNRCMKTSFALTLGQVLAKDEQVLYISLEDCSGFRKIMGQSGSGDFSDVL